MSSISENISWLRSTARTQTCSYHILSSFVSSSSLSSSSSSSTPPPAQLMWKQDGWLTVCRVQGEGHKAAMLQTCHAFHCTENCATDRFRNICYRHRNTFYCAALLTQILLIRFTAVKSIEWCNSEVRLWKILSVHSWQEGVQYHYRYWLTLNASDLTTRQSLAWNTHHLSPCFTSSFFSHLSAGRNNYSAFA